VSNPIAKLNEFFAMAGYTLTLAATALSYSRKIFFRWRFVVREMWVIGVQSLPLVCFFLFLIGMVFALQVGLGLKDFDQEQLIGTLVSNGMVRELGPWMTAFVLIARNGSSMAAEIGTMVVGEEVSALKIMSVHPADFIVMPRMIAFITMAPLLTVLGTAVGILGGMLVAKLQFNVEVYVYVNSLEAGLRPPLVLYWGLLKALIFALTASAVAGAYGLKTSGGALGVGRASRNTVVASLVLVVFLNYVMTSMYTIVEKIVNQAGG